MFRLVLLLSLVWAGCSLWQTPTICCSPSYYPYRLGIEADDEKIDSVFAAVGFDLPPLEESGRAVRLWTDDGLSVARVIEVRESQGSCSATFHYRGTEYDSRGAAVDVDKSASIPGYSGCRALFESLAGADTLDSRPRTPEDPIVWGRSMAVHKLELALNASPTEITFWTQPGSSVEAIAPYEAILAAFERASLGPVTVPPDGAGS